MPHIDNVRLLANNLSNIVALGRMYSRVQEDDPLPPIGVESFGELLQRTVGRLQRAIREATTTIPLIDPFPGRIGRIEAREWLGELAESLARLEGIVNLHAMVAYTNKSLAHRDFASFTRHITPAMGELSGYRRNLNAVRLVPNAAPSTSHALEHAYRPCKEIAAQYGVSAEALRKRLERWRLANDTGYVENTNKAANEPKYLYRAAAVMDEIKALSAIV